MTSTLIRRFVYFIVLLVTFFSPSLLTATVFQELGLSIPIMHYFIVAVLIFMALRTTGKLSPLQRNIIYVFIITIVYLIVIWGLLYGFQIIGGGIRTVILSMLVGIAFIYIFNDHHFNIARFSSLFLNVAFIIALFSLIFYFGYIFNILSIHSYVYPGYTSDNPGWIGFGGAVLPTDFYFLGFQVPRNVSLWSEPARFGQFLEVPLFIALYKLQTSHKKRKYFIYFLTILLALLLTFSVANIFGILLGLQIYLILRIRLKRIIYVVVLIVALIYGNIKLYEFTNSNTKYVVENIFAKNTTGNIQNRFERIESSYELAKENIFGNIHKPTAGASTPFSNAIISGGFIFFALFAFMYLLFLLVLVKRMRSSPKSILYLGFIPFFIALNWFGKYYDYYTLFLLALFTVYLNREAQGKEFI